MMSHAYPSSRILRAYQICQKRQSGIKRVERRLTNLLHWHTSRKQLDKVARFEDCSWVKGFPSGLDRHATLDQVKSTGDSKLLQRSCDHGPCLLQVNLTVFGEKSGKGRFLCETPTDVVIGFEWFLLSQIFKLANEKFFEMKDLSLFVLRATHIPLVNVIRIPRLVLLIRRRHVGRPAMQLDWRERMENRLAEQLFLPTGRLPDRVCLWPDKKGINIPYCPPSPPSFLSLSVQHHHNRIPVLLYCRDWLSFIST